MAGFGQAVAPGQRVAGGAASIARIVVIGDGGQAQQLAWVFRFGGVVAEACGLVLRLGLPHDGVDGGNHALRVAARVVAAQEVTTQAIAHKCLCGDKHLRLGPAKAVDALLGVAHDEHAGRGRPTTRARIARQPRVQRLPLQRVGVLKLIDQQVANARIEPLLHPAGEDGVGQHDQGRALHIVHVHPAVLLLDGHKLRNQAARQPGHALLVLPGLVLAAGGEQALQLGLGLLRGGELLQVLRQAVFLGHEHGLAQHVQALVQVGAGQRVDDGVRRLLRGLVGLGAQSAGTVAPTLLAGCILQGLGRLCKRRQFGVRLLKRRHRGIDHPRNVGQIKLHPLGQRRCQRLVRLRSAMAGHHSFVVGTQAGAVGHGLQKRGPHLTHGLGIVFQQLKVRGQPLLLQQRQRGRAQQRGKPAVEGADLHRAARLQQLAV